MALVEDGFHSYPLRQAGNVRSWKFTVNSTGTFTTTPIPVTSPLALYVDVFGTFATSTVTMQYSPDNIVAYTNTISPLSFTSPGAKPFAPVDVRSGFYRVQIIVTAGNPDLVVNLLALGSIDVL